MAADSTHEADVATVRHWVNGARFDEELIELEAQTLRGMLAAHDAAVTRSAELEAENARMREELDRDRCPATFTGTVKNHRCNRERGHDGRHQAAMGRDWGLMRDSRDSWLLWGDRYSTDTEVVDAPQHAEAAPQRPTRDGEASDR
jgi:hypothetical protein